jgi:hypothetical protein
MGICPAAENGFGLKWLSKRYWNHSCRRWIAARDRKHRDDGIADILQNVASARYDARHDQIKEGIQELNDPLLRKLIGESAETAHVGEQHCRLEVADVASLNGARSPIDPPPI